MHINSLIIGLFALICFCSMEGHMSVADDLNNIPISAPIDTDSAGRVGDIATHAVVRLICVAQDSAGTGFLHKSGNILTADHVIRGCAAPEIILPTGVRIQATVLAEDQDHDLALVKPATPISATPLALAAGNNFKVGAQVSTWGFPAGYSGLVPMLSVGYLAGINAFQVRPGTIIHQWVVNAAFNGGNSGGPLIHIETGQVFGVVSSKLAPISRESAEILQVLENQKFGMQYNGTKPDGTPITFSEAQLVGKVLNELRRQVQLVIGQAVLLEDIKAFLVANKIEP
jgi:S1-C subfamily serine protease